MFQKMWFPVPKIIRSRSRQWRKEQQKNIQTF
jgi:hypothetical protein